MSRHPRQRRVQMSQTVGMDAHLGLVIAEQLTRDELRFTPEERRKNSDWSSTNVVGKSSPDQLLVIIRELVELAGVMTQALADASEADAFDVLKDKVAMLHLRLDIDAPGD